MRLDKILKKLDGLEMRVSALEKRVKTGKAPEESETGQAMSQGKEINFENVLETNVGRYGLLWVGNIILVIGMIILAGVLTGNSKTYLAEILGLGTSLVLFGVAFLIRKNLNYISRLLQTSGIILLYYFLALLHFATNNPLLTDNISWVILLVAVNVAQHVHAIQNRSGLFGFLAFMLTAATAILTNQTHFMLGISAILAGLGVWYFYRLRWNSMLFFSILFTYLLYLIWLMSNPFMGHEIHIVEAPQYNLVYLFLIAGLYSLIALAPDDERKLQDFVLWSILFNGIGFSFMLLFNLVGFYSSNFVGICLLIFVLFFGFSIFLQIKSPWKFAAPLYALYSFLGLSLALYGIFNFPNAFLYLALQSLLVVSVALWFRSRFIVVMNLFLYLILLLSYLLMPNIHNGVNFSFAIAALISARVINWQKQRLEIRTSSMRNTYLVVAFFMMLVAFYRALPAHYIAISWISLAILYFIVSRILNNQKYRWMSIGTLVVSAVYLLFARGEDVDVTFRIVGFIYLALVSILFSVIYTRGGDKSGKNDVNN